MALSLGLISNLERLPELPEILFFHLLIYYKGCDRGHRWKDAWRDGHVGEVWEAPTLPPGAQPSKTLQKLPKPALWGGYGGFHYIGIITEGISLTFSPLLPSAGRWGWKSQPLILFGLSSDQRPIPQLLRGCQLQSTH